MQDWIANMTRSTSPPSTLAFHSGGIMKGSCTVPTAEAVGAFGAEGAVAGRFAGCAALAEAGRFFALI